MLNSLRFFAFLWVFVGHLPKTEHSTWLLPFQFTNWVGVHVFFVLSSFLVTHLAIAEINRSGRFSMRNFFARRALRLLPLYFVIVFIGFFAYPFLNVEIGPTCAELAQCKDFLSAFPFYSLFISNFAPDVFGVSWTNVGGMLAPLWSITVEIHFYIAFALFLFIFLRFCRINILTELNYPITLFATTFALLFISNGYISEVFGPLFVYVNLWGGLNAFLVGIVFGMAYNSNQHKPYFILLGAHWHLQACLLIVIAVSLIVIFRLPHVTSISISVNVGLAYLASALLSGGIVLFVLSLEACATTEGERITKLARFLSVFFSNSRLSSFGEISYGLYVFHTSVIHFIAVFLIAFMPAGRIWYALMLLACLFVTLFFAKISYHFFELKFVRFSGRFKT